MAAARSHCSSGFALRSGDTKAIASEAVLGDDTVGRLDRKVHRSTQIRARGMLFARDGRGAPHRTPPGPGVVAGPESRHMRNRGVVPKAGDADQKK
jgi:hypothetical protein